MMNKVNRDLNEKQMAKKEVKKNYLILYLSICVVCLFFVICRWISTINPSLTILPEIIDIHVTNFSLSLMLSIFTGFTVLISGGKMKIIRIISIIIVFINLVYEVFVPILNTPDFVDALAGIIGVVISYLYLSRLNRNGLIDK